METKLKLFALLFFLLFIGACNAKTEPLEERYKKPAELSALNLEAGEKLKVVATSNIIGDLVANVGGEMIDLTTMLPPGADPHSYTPTPQDVVAVAEADVVFINGLGLEGFLGKLIENAGGQAEVVSLSNNVQIRALAETLDHADNHEAELEDHNSAVDPHIWLSPANAVIMVENIELALSQLDPTNAQTYQANAQTYIAQLTALDEWVKAEIESIPVEKRVIITDHDAFGYYAGRYGLKVVGTVISGLSANAEASAQELAHLQEVVASFDVPAVFVGSTVNPVLARRVAEDSGARLVFLYTGSLGEENSGAETYLDFIRYNTNAITESLR